MFVALGRVSKTHGLKGEVSLITDRDASLEVLLGARMWVVPPPSGLRSTRLLAVRPGPKGWLVSLEGVGDIDVARTLAGCELLVHRDDLPQDWDDDPVLDETGYAVTDEVRGPLGSIDEVLVTGANDVWVVHGPLGEILIPVIDDVVLEVDHGARSISVRLLPGLIEGDES